MVYDVHWCLLLTQFWWINSFDAFVFDFKFFKTSLVFSNRVSYGASLSGWFWLFKLEKTNGIAHVFIGEANGIKRKSEWCILEGIRANLMHEWSVTQTSPKLIQFLHFEVLKKSGTSLNMFRGKNVWKTCE